MSTRYSTLGDLVRITAQPKLTTDDRFAWQDEALCRETDKEIFFSDQGGQARQDIAYAKSVCRQCPVATQCLQAALDRREEWGVWGGTTPEERRVKLGRKPKRTSSNPLVRKMCGACGKQFETRYSRNIWCSEKCGTRGRNARAKAAAA